MLNLNKKEILRQMIHFSGILVVFIPESWNLITVGSMILIMAGIAYTLGSYIHEKSTKGKMRIVKFAAAKAKRVLDIAERKNVFLLKGVVMFFAGISITMIVFSDFREIALLSVLCLAVGDSLSTMVGIHLGMHKMPRNKKKSWEGTLAGLAGILIFGSFFFDPKMVMIAAVVAMFVEAYVKKIDDNFAIPLITGSVIFALQMFFLI